MLLMLKRLPLIIIFGLLSACAANEAQPQENLSPVVTTPTSSTPSSGIGDSSATLISPPTPSHTPVLPGATQTFAPLASWTPTIPPSPSPTWTGTPPTPTQLATPYVIEVLDWEMVEVTSPELCAGCNPGITAIDVPRGMGIALVQVFIAGEPGARSSLTTDLLYAIPEELRCTRQAENGFCGMIFGQVYANQLLLSAEHAAGGAHRLKYIVTFQSWAKYNP